MTSDEESKAEVVRVTTEEASRLTKEERAEAAEMIRRHFDPNDPFDIHQAENSWMN